MARSVPGLGLKFGLGMVMAMVGGSLPASDGVIFYNRIAAPNAPVTLWRVGADGTGDRPVPVNLPAPIYPTGSRLGQRLLVTSTDPGRPFKISNNVFLYDVNSGQSGRITQFEDVGQIQNVSITNDLGQVTNNFVYSGYTINFPYHKAFSPDGSRVVVVNLRKTGSTSRDGPSSSTNGPGQLYVTSGRFPAIEIYRVADAQPEGSYVFLGIERSGFNQGGDGVDWHPNRPEIVATVSSDIPATGTLGRTSTEGTILAKFTASGPSQFLGRLGAPVGRADVFYPDGFNFVVTTATPHDYAPAISPDGSRVAYARHLLRQDTRFDGAGIAPLPAQCSLRMIHYDGAGDQELLTLADGWWVTKIAWAPDGSELAFDAAPQAVIRGWNSLLGDVTRSEIHLVRADGTNPRRLVAAPAAFPTWLPAAGGEPPQPPTLSATRNGSRLDLQVNQLAPGRAARMETSSDLRSWTILSNFTASAATHSVSVSLAPGSSSVFYRVTLP
jgi:WD40 repeat protein